MRIKIRQHPRMKNICVGDEVMCTSRHLYAQVEEIFPAAVCVKVATLQRVPVPRIVVTPQLWRADDIENLSVCRLCASRDNLLTPCGTGIPFRVCLDCYQAHCGPGEPPA
jgi:hypothetical protein